MSQYSNHKRYKHKSQMSRTDTLQKTRRIITWVFQTGPAAATNVLYKSQTCPLIQYIQTPHSGTLTYRDIPTPPIYPQKNAKTHQVHLFVYIKTSFLSPPHPQTSPPHLRLACKSILAVIL